jgi:hypothetical protein
MPLAKLKGYTMPHRTRRKQTRGICTVLEHDVSNAVKKLALSMDVSCTSVINAILRKSLKM